MGEDATVEAPRERARPVLVRGIRVLVGSPLAEAHAAGLGDRGTREALAVVTTSYEHHGGFRLRTLSA